MRLLVLAALAAVALADVSHLTGYHYDVPASSYGVPQNSVTERQFYALPTAPSPSLHLPTFEHQDFKAFNPLPGGIISTTAAPSIDAGIVSSTPAPSVDTSLLVSSTPAPSVVDGGALNLGAQLPNFGSGFTYTTPAPSLSFNSGGLESVSQLGGLNSGFVSSTSAPHIVVTSGSQENLNVEPQLSNLGFNAGFNAFTTPAPSLFSSTAAPISTLAPSLGLGLGSAYSFPGFGLDSFSTPAPIALGSSGLFGNGVSVHGITSGGSINDAFGSSYSGTVSAGILPQPQQVSKHLYFYAAPEDPEPARPRVSITPVAPPKKNVKVIFIKAPAPPAPPPISIAAPPQNEEKTVVYVLVKKPEDTQHIEIQTPPPTSPAKPEVYFIKYKTPQEAEEAIAKVQSTHAEGPALSVPDNTVNGNILLSSINRDGPVTSLPAFNFVTSTTTPAPLLNLIGGGISGPIQNGGLVVGHQIDDSDISQNLISSGGHGSSLFTTGAPLISSLSPLDGSFFGTTTVAPSLVPHPHPTYGPPVLKRK